MTPRTRAAWLITALLPAILVAPSCQWAGDTSAVKVSYATLRHQIDDVNGRLVQALQDGETGRVAALDKEMIDVLDKARSQSAAMNILDREHLSINAATAGQCLSEMNRYAQTGDLGLLRAQARQLAPTVAEILVLLDRAERTTTAK